MTVLYTVTLRRIFMSFFPNDIPGGSGIFLKRRRDWFQRAMGKVPVKPASGDLAAVQDALLDVIDAASGLEFSRGELFRIMAMSQKEYSSLQSGVDQEEPRLWGGATAPAV